MFGLECGGHSDRVTPEPIPNSEDKPVRVLHCTQVREPSGNADRCHIHLTLSSIRVTVIKKALAFLLIYVSDIKNAILEYSINMETPEVYALCFYSTSKYT